jgi:hypothetical protein
MIARAKPMELTERDRGRSGVIAKARAEGGHETPTQGMLAMARKLEGVVAELTALDEEGTTWSWDPSPDDE